MKFFEFGQGHRAQDGAGPGPKILGGEIAAANLPQVIVHIARTDIPRPTVLVYVLKQFLTGEVLAASDDFGQVGISDIHLMPLASFTPEAEMESRTIHFHVPIAHGR